MVSGQHLPIGGLPVLVAFGVLDGDFIVQHGQLVAQHLHKLGGAIGVRVAPTFLADERPQLAQLAELPSRVVEDQAVLRLGEPAEGFLEPGVVELALALAAGEHLEARSGELVGSGQEEHVVEPGHAGAERHSRGNGQRGQHGVAFLRGFDRHQAVRVLLDQAHQVLDPLLAAGRRFGREAHDKQMLRRGNLHHLGVDELVGIEDRLPVDRGRRFGKLPEDRLGLFQVVLGHAVGHDLDRLLDDPGLLDLVPDLLVILLLVVPLGVVLGIDGHERFGRSGPAEIQRRRLLSRHGQMPKKHRHRT